MADAAGGGMGSLFGGAPKPAESKGPSTGFISQQVSNVTTRLRVIEERYTNERKKMQLIEQNMLKNQKKFTEDIKLVHSEIDEMKHTMTEIENKIVLLIKEIRLMAKKEDVDTMKKYLEMWEPVHFVTQAQAEKIAQEAVEEALAAQKSKK